MRIIAGVHRGRTYLSPEGLGTRPVTDRVKQALFSSIETRLGTGTDLWAGVAVADLFCGTGSMGLEALSRGAAWGTFVEQERSVVKLLRQNLSDFGFQDRSRIEPIDLLAATPDATATPTGGFDVLLLDPPYRFSVDSGPGTPMAAMIERFAGIATVQPRPAILMVRTQRGARVATRYAGWTLDDVKHYGTMSVHYLLRDA